MKKKPAENSQPNKILNALHPDYIPEPEEIKIPIGKVKEFLLEVIPKIVKEGNKWKSWKGGSAPKEKRGISLAIEAALQKSPRKSALGLWEYFRESHNTVGCSWVYWDPQGHWKTKGDRLDVYFEEGQGNDPDKLIEVWNENDKEGKAIQFKAFENYVRKVKKHP